MLYLFLTYILIFILFLVTNLQIISVNLIIIPVELPLGLLIFFYFIFFSIGTLIFKYLKKTIQKKDK